MHEQLIGQLASLNLPCNVDAAGLLQGFIEELMEVDGSQAKEPDGLRRDLEAAVETLCRGAESDETCQVTVTFDIQDAQVEMRLTCDAGGGADEQVVVARTG